MQRMFVLAAAVLPALLCGAVAAEVPAPVAAGLPRAMGLAQGRWHTLLTVTGASVRPLRTGAKVPPELEAGLKAQVGKPVETDDCIGHAPAPGGDLVLPGVRIAGDCRYDEASAAGGTLRIRASCGDPAKGFFAQMAIDGHHSATAMDSMVTIMSRQGEPELAVRMELTAKSSRVGECPA